MTASLRLLLAFALACGSVSCKEEGFPSRTVLSTDANAPGQATRDLSPVDLHLQERKERRVEPFYGDSMLRVPKAYLRGRDHWQGHIDSLGGVTVEAALPDLRPWTIFAEELFDKMKVTDERLLINDTRAFKNAHTRAFMKDWVTIVISYGHCFAAVKAFPAHLGNWARKDQTYHDPLLERFEAGKGKDGLRSFYMPRLQGPMATYIECSETGGDLRRCRGTSDYDALISFQYSFSILRLRQFREIEDKSRTLLASFVSRNQPTAALPTGCLVNVVGSVNIAHALPA